MFDKQQTHKITKPLPRQSTKYGSEHLTIRRNGNKIVNEITSPTGRKSWEVMINYVDKKGVEWSPGSSMWGTRGWTFNDLDQALHKFDEI